MLDRGGRSGEVAAGEKHENATLEKTRKVGRRGGRCWQTGGASRYLKPSSRRVFRMCVRRADRSSREHAAHLEYSQTWRRRTGCAAAARARTAAAAERDTRLGGGGYGELALPAERRRREARQSARAAMRVRQGTLLDDAQNGGVLGGDAGTCHHGTDRLVELARATTADWARRAARSRWHSQGIGRGRGGRSGEALWRVHELVFVCGGCSGLVNGQAARVRAYAEGRLSFAGTDGCGSSACSGNHRSGSYRAGQASMARALLEGERRLVRWPLTTAHTHVWVVGDEERRMVAEGVLRSRGPEACWVRRS